MINKFWVLVYDGNNWISYSQHDSFLEAKEASREVHARWHRTRIAFVLAETE